MPLEALREAIDARRLDARPPAPRGQMPITQPGKSVEIIARIHTLERRAAEQHPDALLIHEPRHRRPRNAQDIGVVQAGCDAEPAHLGHLAIKLFEGRQFVELRRITLRDLATIIQGENSETTDQTSRRCLFNQYVFADIIEWIDIEPAVLTEECDRPQGLCPPDILVADAAPRQIPPLACHRSLFTSPA